MRALKRRYLGTPQLFAAEAEVPDFVALPPGLGLVAGFRPATRTALPALGPFHEPLEVGSVTPHDHQGVAQVYRMIGAEPELAARLQLGREHGHRPIVHHPTLRVAGLRPG